MGVEVDVAVGTDKDGNVYANMTGDTLGILIGRRGETLDALQYLTSLKVNRGQEGYTRVTLDTENYRAKREEALARLANRMANRAIKTGRKVSLEPMNPYERRILHSALQPTIRWTPTARARNPIATWSLPCANKSGAYGRGGKCCFPPRPLLFFPRRAGRSAFFFPGTIGHTLTKPANCSLIKMLCYSISWWGSEAGLKEELLLQVLQSILQAISALLSGWLMFMLVYQMVLTVLGFRRRTKDYADHAPQSRFLVLVPAHNEEKVIGDIIENLQRMDYPRELYDFYVIADNWHGRHGAACAFPGRKGD